MGKISMVWAIETCKLWENSTCLRWGMITKTLYDNFDEDGTETWE